jgi:hypothetical protein
MKATSSGYEQLRDYIGGRLSEDDRRRLEERLVRDPQLVSELEETLQLREGLRALRTQGHLPAAATPRTTWSRSWPEMVLAAAAVAGVAFFLGIRPRTEAPPLLTASAAAHGTGLAAAVSAQFTFVAVRGDATPDLDLPPAGQIELRAAPDVRVPGSTYRLILARQETGGVQQLGAVGGLALGADGYVHGYAQASRLPPGRYLLRIERDDASRVAGMFTFRLRAVPR